MYTCLKGDIRRSAQPEQRLYSQRKQFHLTTSPLVTSSSFDRLEKIINIVRPEKSGVKRGIPIDPALRRYDV
jgi:hypothetical protein